MINNFVNATSHVPLHCSMGDCARYSGKLAMTVKQKNHLEAKQQKTNNY